LPLHSLSSSRRLADLAMTSMKRPEDVSALVSSEEFQNEFQKVTLAATEQAEEFMEAVMKETIRMLRSDMQSEILQVAEATKKLESACVRNYQLKGHELKLSKAQEDFQKTAKDTEQKVADCIKAQEELRKEVVAQKGKLTAALEVRGYSTAHEEVKKQVARHAEQLDECFKAQEELKKAAAHHKDQLAASLQSQGDSKVEEQLAAYVKAHEELKKEVAEHKFMHKGGQRELASHEEVKKQVAGQEGQLTACLKAQEELRKDVADLKTQLAACLSQQKKSLSEVTQGDLARLKKELNTNASNLRGDLMKALEDNTQGLQANLGQQQVNFATIGHVDKQVSDLLEHLSEIKSELALRNGSDIDAKKISDLQSHVTQMKAEGTKEQIAEMKDQMRAMRKELSERSVTPGADVEATKATTLSLLEAHGAATKEHIDKQISELNAQLSQIKSAQTQSDFVTRSDLEAVKTGTLSELKGHGDAIKEHVERKISALQLPTEPLESKGVQNQSNPEAMKQVDKQISDLQAQVTQINGQQEASLKELRGHGEATKENVTKQISDLHSHVSEIKEHLAQRTDKSEAVTRADLDAMRDYLLGHTSQLSGHVQELRKLADCFHPQVQKELKALNGHVADIRKQSSQSDAHVELQEVQRNMNAHLYELREVVDKLVKSSSKGTVDPQGKMEDKVASLEHEVEELRSEASSLRLAVAHQESRAAEKKKAKEDGVFCQLFR